MQLYNEYPHTCELSGLYYLTVSLSNFLSFAICYIKLEAMGKKMTPTTAPAKGHPYNMQVPKSFLLLSLMFPAFLAYIVGCAARIYLLQNNLPPSHFNNAVPNAKLGAAKSDTKAMDTVSLPLPVVSEDKEVPLTVFTSRNFAVDNVRSSNTMHIQPRRSTGKKQNTVDDDAKNESGVMHEPAGQHLLVDIKHVDSDFLDSEHRLALAMVELIAESGLTLLSYHCHSMIPAGVSCVGVLLESHVSFHTWPAEGVITLDLFTCGANPLLPAMPMIERLFAIPQTGEAFTEEPRLLWSHKMRGFREKDSILENDSSLMVLDRMEYDYKHLVGSTKTIYQQIDIYDYINPRFNDLRSFEKSLLNDGSYEAENPELYSMSRIILLDGVLQSTSDGDEAYHESLVHPAMFAHPNPRRAAIIGGGEGATLREVLKHNTIETVKMIDIDDEMMQFSRKHLPLWSDCSDIVGSADCCFDDPRADVYALDAMAWFVDRYASTCLSDDDKECSDESSSSLSEDPFDVIIMDALDPQDNVEFADVLYSNTIFWQSLYDALTPDGMMVMQLGISPSLRSEADHLGKNRRRAELIAGLEDMGFKSMYAYEDVRYYICFHAGYYLVVSYFFL